MRFLSRALVIFFFSMHVYANSILIGTLGFAPPFEMVANQQGDLAGFEIDLMNEICRRMQQVCQYKPMPFNHIFDAVQSGEVDLGMAAITITEDRQLLFAFSLPYMVARGQLLANIHSKITRMSEADGNWIGVEAGSIFKSIAKQKFNTSKVIEYNNQQDLFYAVANREIDFILFDKASAQYWVDNNPGTFKMIGPGFHLGEGYGIVANMNRQALINQINKALLSMEEDGTYLTIYERYFYL